MDTTAEGKVSRDLELTVARSERLRTIVKEAYELWPTGITSESIEALLTASTELHAEILRLHERIWAREETESRDENLRHLFSREERPSKRETMMGCAHLMALRSTCSRLRVGAVITDPDMTRIYAVGYNGNFRGGPNRCDSDTPGACGCLHAEDNALVKLQTEASELLLFTTASPCSTCAKRIINQGKIKTVYFQQRYRSADGIELLRAADVACVPL